MEDYKKLTEAYQKLRAQASVLKRAVIEEQNKSGVLRETLRIKDQSLRRAENELDSLNFRNKQLEHRVSNLQDDLQDNHVPGKDKNKSQKHHENQFGNGQVEIDPIFAEELRKRIMENAGLQSLISDKDNDIELYTSRIKDLEHQQNKQSVENTELERKLRREIEVVSARNADLETKMVEAASTLGSEDGLSVTDSDCTTPLHHHASISLTTDDRIVYLEKELNRYRTQYEMLKINDVLKMDENLTQPQKRKVLSSQSSTSTTSSSLSGNPSTSNGPNRVSAPSKIVPDPEEPIEINRDQLIYDYFSKRFDELFLDKSKAETKVINFMSECESLKSNLELLTDDINNKDEAWQESQKMLKYVEEDLAITRINYEEQISVLTEQVISLSEQLANSR